MTKDERRDLLLLRAGEFDESAATCEQLLEQTRAERAEVEAGGGDTTALDERERDLIVHRDEFRRDAEAFAREARGEGIKLPGPLPWAARWALHDEAVGGSD